jgi:hypothetical protein
LPVVENGSRTVRVGGSLSKPKCFACVTGHDAVVRPQCFRSGFQERHGIPGGKSRNAILFRIIGERQEGFFDRRYVAACEGGRYVLNVRGAWPVALPMIRFAFVARGTKLLVTRAQIKREGNWLR